MIYSNIKHYKFYIKKDKLNQLEKYGFIKNDSSLFKEYLYINKCGTIQNRLYVYRDLRLRYGNINSATLKVLYDLIKDNILEYEED